jgi:hypothetical protein
LVHPTPRHCTGDDVRRMGSSFAAPAESIDKRQPERAHPWHDVADACAGLPAVADSSPNPAEHGGTSAPRKRPLGPHQRRALQLMASIPFGAPETAMFVNGFARQTLVRLIRTGLATGQHEHIKAGQPSAVSGLLGPVDGARRLLSAGRRRVACSPNVTFLFRNAAAAAGVGLLREVISRTSRSTVLYHTSKGVGALPA